MADRSPPLYFDINPTVVFRLGEELITDVVQALVELVKNSYDADATWVNISIDTHANNESSYRFADATGVILVEDNGHGMDQETIQAGWLTIANSSKLDVKAAGQVTGLGRTPIGDKGLGRLGTQKLARNIEFFTRPSANPNEEYYLAFSWTDFRTTERLRQVRITSDRKTVESGRSGTRLILSDLLEPEVWRTEQSLLDLQRKLSSMLSPFQISSDFRVHLHVDGKAIDLAEIAQRIRETALLRYAFSFDGHILTISGQARLNYFQPPGKEDREYFRSLCQEDGGLALFEFLKEKGTRNRPPDFSLSKQKGWFVDFGTQRELEVMPDMRRACGQAVDPGPFHGEVDAVSLDVAEYEGLGIGRQSEYRQLVRELAGIRVYRDGFGIRVGEDWLKLGRQWTGGSSYYGLRPGNVLGYVAISARDNPRLMETTSREGFQVTPHYENFYGLVMEFVHFTGTAQEFLRRGVRDFLDTNRDIVAGVKTNDPHTEMTNRIADIAGMLTSEKTKVRGRRGTLRKATTRAADTLARVRNEFEQGILGQGPMPAAVQSLEEEIAKLSATATDVETVLTEMEAALEQAAELTAMKGVLERRWSSLNEHVSTLYESVSLGLTAEVLSHEIHNIASRLARRSTVVARQLNKEDGRVGVLEYIEHVRTSVAAMRKQLSHLTPSLRYLREEREYIDLAKMLNELAEFHNERFRKRKIRVEVEVGKDSSTTVYMNKGKLTQIFDNLILNSEYWLREAIRSDFVGRGIITLAVDGSIVRVMDNGRGVDVDIEETVFEPFVTMKRARQGRGLGLFVVQQLLDSEACQAALLPARNPQGRRYSFEIDLSGAVND